VLEVQTVTRRLGGASVEMAQEIFRDGTVLFRAEVCIACIDAGSGAPARLPPDIRERLRQTVRP